MRSADDKQGVMMSSLGPLPACCGSNERWQFLSSFLGFLPAHYLGILGLQMRTVRMSFEANKVFLSRLILLENAFP